jgi:hypothetical protein
MIAYLVNLNENATLGTVLQVHPDAASAGYHMQEAGPAFAGFAKPIRLSGIVVYGSPGSELLERLPRKARTLGGGSVDVHLLHARFARFGVPGIDAHGRPAGEGGDPRH